MSPHPPAGLLYAAWLAALGATLGSLFFGEVMQLPPCTLCWYQRICMFPLALLLPVGIVLRDPRVVWYCLPLVVGGLGVALYHVGVEQGLIPERLTPCTGGVSCKERPIEWLGFVTIPALALAAFATIGICLLAYQRKAGRVRG
jgi:disulfide bond formation protein DsbB